MLLSEVAGKMEQPNVGKLWIVIPVMIMGIPVLLPSLGWFVRNFLSIVLNKNIELLNRSVKWFFLFGPITFVISIILLSLVATGVIKT